MQKKIITIMAKHGLVDPAEALPPDDTASLPKLFQSLCPERFLMYDSECIAEPTAYLAILDGYSRITCGQWEVDDTSISGDTTTDLHLSFKSFGECCEWVIPQAGSDYVSEHFVESIEEFAEKRLKGKFIHLPTGDQTLVCVYLPTAAAKQVLKLIDAQLSVDRVCEWILRGDSRIHTDAFAHGLTVHPEIFDQRSRSGDTVLTAAIVAGDERFTTFIMDLGANLRLLGRNNWTPRQLALEVGNHDLAERLEWEEEGEAIDKNASDALSTASAPDKFTEFMAAVIRQPWAEGLYYQWDDIWSQLIFARSASFRHGEDVLYLKLADGGFEVCLSLTGSNGKYVSQKANTEQALRLLSALRAHVVA